MEFSNLFADDDAVSPVIGVILMVAITVILAAVIGTFVLGLGDQVSNTSPTASFTFDFEEGAGGSPDCGSTSGSGLLTITHDGGDSIEASQLTVSPSDGDSQTWENCASSGDVTAGDSVTADADPDETVRMTWEASSGGDTATLGKWTGPDA